MSNITHLIILFILIFKIGIIVINISKYKTFLFTLKVLYFTLIASFLADIITYVLSWIHVETSLIVNTYIVIEGFLLIFYFKHVGEKWAFPFSVILFLSVALLEWIVFTQNSKFLDMASVLESIILMVFSLRYFGRMLEDLHGESLSKNPFFWINFAILFNFSASLFLFAFGYLIIENSILILWHLYNVIQLIYLFLISIAFWKVRLTQI